MAQSLRNPDDFTLRIVVTAPEPGRPSLDDEQIPTTPFKKIHITAVADAQPRALRPKPEPLSHDDHDRVMRRARAFKKIAWARQMLRKFGFEERA